MIFSELSLNSICCLPLSSCNKLVQYGQIAPDNKRRLMMSTDLSGRCWRRTGTPWIMSPDVPMVTRSPLQRQTDTGADTGAGASDGGSQWDLLIFYAVFILYYTCNLNDNKYGCGRQMDLGFDFDLRIGNKIVFNNTNCVNIGNRGIFKSDISFRVGRGIFIEPRLAHGTAFKRGFLKVSPVKSGYMSRSTPGCRL